MAENAEIVEILARQFGHAVCLGYFLRRGSSCGHDGDICILLAATKTDRPAIFAIQMGKASDAELSIMELSMEKPGGGCNLNHRLIRLPEMWWYSSHPEPHKNPGQPKQPDIWHPFGSRGWFQIVSNRHGMDAVADVVRAGPRERLQSGWQRGSSLSSPI